MIVEMKFELPPKSIVTDVPEEHAQLIIHQGKVWTFGDLAFEDVNRFFYGIDFGLGREARDRMHDKLLATNPTAFWNRPIWPNQTWEGRA
jgi:hypothetical protein